MGQREQWNHRTGFILAAIGSAIGLGNVWRFPYVCYKYGGGAFLIPYFIALFAAGIPIMILEFGIGHRLKGGAPVALGKIKRGWEWLGWFALLVAFIITCYYAVIMGWCVSYLKYSTTLAWGSDPGNFFFHKFLNISKTHFEIGGLQRPVVIGLIISWIAIIGAIWKGTKSVGKVIYVTVIVPWIILLVFLFRSVTLPGAFTGLAFYLTPDFSALTDLEVWSAAFTQVFFSLSLGFGVMIAYASFLPEKSDIVNNAFIISLMDAGTAFVGGIVVFATLGHYAYLSGQPVESVIKAGPSLAFITYPTIINSFPVMSRFIGFLFFFMLFTLGIDSAFSLVESVVTGIMDKFHTPRKITLLSVGAIGLTIGLFFCSRAGLLWLDLVDHYMNQYGLMTVCLLEVIVLGWLVKTEDYRNYINTYSEIQIGKWWNYTLKYFIPVVLSILMLSWLGQRINSSYENYSRNAEFLGGWLLIFLLPVIALILSKSYRMAGLLTAIFSTSLLGSIFCYMKGLDFSAIVIFNLAYILLFGGTALCINKSRIHISKQNYSDN